jgi:hypothetical protein
MALAATLFAVFFTVEDWRGRRAWDKCRRALEAKGEVLDWSAYIPAPVPDDQNFYKAPSMQEWFVRESLTALVTRNATGASPFVIPPPPVGGKFVVADVSVVTSSAAREAGPAPADAVLQFVSPKARPQAASLLLKALGPCAVSGREGVLVGSNLEQFKPLHLVLQSDTPLTKADLAGFLPQSPLTNAVVASSECGSFFVESSGSNAFRVGLKGPISGAQDYLESTEFLNADFDLIRKALERPYARIDCDYGQPFGIAVPNFSAIRGVAQTLSARAQAYLVLGQPEAAWHELSLVHDLCQILQAKPSGKPLTLVGAMIHVAVAGLYVSIVDDGLRLHAWREPQLLAIGRQLDETDLLSLVFQAFQEEEAAVLRTFETTSRRELVKSLLSASPSRSVVGWMPRGWFYQNLVAMAETRQELLAGMDVTNRVIVPDRVSEIVRRASLKSTRYSPYTFLAVIGQPNYAKATQTVARNQTLVSEARLV